MVSNQAEEERLMRETQEQLTKICERYGYEISFDDKFGNFGTSCHQAASHSFIECAKYQPWNHDMLKIDVFHELGHLENQKTVRKLEKQKTIDAPPFLKSSKWINEWNAWNWAIVHYVDEFHQCLTVKQARHIMQSLQSYIPDYNNPLIHPDSLEEKESFFWDREIGKCRIDHLLLK